MKNKGLGDSIKKLIEATGASIIHKKLTQTKECGGCEKRKEYLNKIVPYKKAGIKLTDLI